MIAYTIYIIGTRKILPQEGKTSQRFQREGYKDARNYFLAKFASSSSASSSIVSSTTTSSSGLFCNEAAAASDESLSFIDATDGGSTSPSTPPLLYCSSSPCQLDGGDSEREMSTTTPLSKILGCDKAAYLHGHFYFNIYKEEEKGKLDEMWLKPVIQIGEVVAGDEKLYHYTAHHMNTKAVPQKKDVSNMIDIFLYSHIYKY